MSKQVLENVLGLWLSDNQIDYIKTQWHYFYNNPNEFKNSIFISMIRIDLADYYCM